jgi:hypothetical protein
MDHRRARDLSRSPRGRGIGARTAALALLTAGVLYFAVTAFAAGPGGWDHLGHGATASTPALDGAVDALNADNPGTLYVGGNFLNAGGHAAADHLASWDGSAWSTVGPGLNGDVHAIAYHAGKVYAGGTFTNAGGNPNADFLAVWDGSHWSPFCTSTGPDPAFGGSVNALQIIGSTLYAGGSFQNGADIDAADYLLACNLTTGTASATVDSAPHSFNGGVYALTADSGGNLYAGGQFINLEGIPAADHVAAYLGGGIWQAMGSGPSVGGGAVDSYVRSITSHGTNVYVGSDSVNIAGLAKADHVARWNGSAWSAMGSNTAGTDGWFPASSFIYSMDTSGSLVFATGSFQNANGNPLADDIAYFNGTAWHSLGSNGAGNGPFIGNGLALAPFRQHLILGGNFTSAGGDTLAQEAASHPILQPDARIGTAASGPFLGNNVYSASAQGESKTISVARGSSGVLFANIQNDGLTADDLKVVGPTGSAGYAVHYFDGPTDVTSQVSAGTFSTGTLAPGASVTLKIVVHLSATSANQGSFLIQARSKPGASPDAVRATVNAQ